MSVAEIISDEMARHPGRALRSVEIDVGTLSGVETVSFTTAMDSVLASEGYTGARCVLNRVEGHASCIDCGTSFAASGRWPSCPACGSARCFVTSGTEFRVTSLTLE